MLVAWSDTCTSSSLMHFFAPLSTLCRSCHFPFFKSWAKAYFVVWPCLAIVTFPPMTSVQWGNSPSSSQQLCILGDYIAQFVTLCYITLHCDVCYIWLHYVTLRLCILGVYIALLLLSTYAPASTVSVVVDLVRTWKFKGVIRSVNDPMRSPSFIFWPNKRWFILSTDFCQKTICYHN